MNNSARGITQNHSTTNPLRMLSAPAEQLGVCKSNMAAQDGAIDIETSTFSFFKTIADQNLIFGDSFY